MVRGEKFPDGQDWSDLKPDFELLLKQSRGEKVDAMKAEIALQRVQLRCRNTALFLLWRWHIRNLDWEVPEVVQEWNLQMYTKVFARCDESKPIHAYAYWVLRHCCTSVVKREAKHRVLPPIDEPAHDKDDMLDAMIETEEMTRLMQALTQLPANLNWAVRQWLAHRELNLKMQFESPEEQHQFHNRMYRARLRIREILNANGSKDDQPENLFRAA